MTRRNPGRPTVQAKPIGHDPHAGHYQVVVSFRVAQPSDPATVEAYVRKHLGDLRGLDIAVRVIGAAGEKSQQVEWPPGSAALNLTEDVEVHHTTRDHTDIDPGGKL